MLNKLHLGCGNSYLKGYINIDLPVERHNVIKPKCDIYCDIMKVAFPLNSFDEIRSHHIFEHFNRVEALAFLIKCTLWLKHNGVLIIETPDAEGCAEIICSKIATYSQKMAHIRHLSGSHTEPTAVHVDHWFAERFSNTLPQFGYTIKHITKRAPSFPNVIVVANRTTLLSHDKLIDISKEILLLSLHAPKLEQPTYNFWIKTLYEITKLEDIIKDE